MALKPIFRGFCINRFGIGPLHFNSSRFDFGFEFAEIFIIEKRCPDSASRGVADFPTRSRRVGYWLWKLPSSVFRRVIGSTPGLAESESWRLHDFPGRSLSGGIANSPTRQVWESLWWIRELVFEFFKFIIDLEEARDVIDFDLLKSLKKLQLSGLASRGVVSRLQISPRIRSQNRNGSKGTVRDSCGTALCKTPEKSDSLPCPFNDIFWPFYVFIVHDTYGCLLVAFWKAVKGHNVVFAINAQEGLPADEGS